MKAKDFSLLCGILDELDIIVKIYRHGKDYEVYINSTCIAVYKHRVSAKLRIIRDYAELVLYFKDYFARAMNEKFINELDKWRERMIRKSAKGRKPKKPPINKQTPAAVTAKDIKLI